MLRSVLPIIVVALSLQAKASAASPASTALGVANISILVPFRSNDFARLEAKTDDSLEMVSNSRVHFKLAVLARGSKYDERQVIEVLPASSGVVFPRGSTIIFMPQ